MSPMSKERMQALFGKVVADLKAKASQDPNHPARLFLAGPWLPPELEELFKVQDETGGQPTPTK